ncbi:hypothetical protein ACEQ8H_004608 [Pleosporales sp. CAS-2024a]
MQPLTDDDLAILETTVSTLDHRRNLLQAETTTSIELPAHVRLAYRAQPSLHEIQASELHGTAQAAHAALQVQDFSAYFMFVNCMDTGIPDLGESPIFRLAHIGQNGALVSILTCLDAVAASPATKTRSLTMKNRIKSVLALLDQLTRRLRAVVSLGAPNGTGTAMDMREARIARCALYMLLARLVFYLSRAVNDDAWEFSRKWRFFRELFHVHANMSVFTTDVTELVTAVQHEYDAAQAELLESTQLTWAAEEPIPVRDISTVITPAGHHLLAGCNCIICLDTPSDLALFAKPDYTLDEDAVAAQKALVDRLAEQRRSLRFTMDSFVFFEAEFKLHKRCKVLMHRASRAKSRARSNSWPNMRVKRRV